MAKKYIGRPIRALGVILAAGLGMTEVAQADELLVNGDFEGGGLVGWTVTDQAGSFGTWFAGIVGAPTPVSGFLTSSLGGGAGTYAVSDQFGPAASVLTQGFTIPIGAAGPIWVGFDMFINDWDSGPIVDPAGLDWTAFPNQHARVDILTATAAPLSTMAADIAVSLVAPTVDPQASNPNPFSAYLFDISAFVTPGTSYQLRFAQVDNQLFLHQGVDNVTIQAEIPEPATLALLGLGIAGIGCRRWRKAV